MFGVAGRAIRISVTVILLICALIALVAIWDHYLTAPWTRDGQIQVNVVNLAPQVSGQITEVHVRDNQQVRKGDLLYVIEPIDYQIAEAVQQATADGKAADLALKQSEIKRRLALTDLSTSREEVQTYQSGASVAAASYALALAQLNQSKIDVQRTRGAVTGEWLRHQFAAAHRRLRDQGHAQHRADR